MTTDNIAVDEAAAVVATADVPLTARRLFQVGDKTFPDPGVEYSVDNVLRHLQTFLPELAHARTEEQALADGTRLITFTKQVTRKGSGTPLATLAAALLTVPPYADPLVPFYDMLVEAQSLLNGAMEAGKSKTPLTLRTLRAHTAQLHACVKLVHNQTGEVQRLVTACQHLPPMPLPCLPWDF
ncbi:MAG: hypothetical protein KC413_18385 [Anaerolineales bacterium]|nr:hypothetical protein [Anaerolineales bacterium]